MLKKKILLQLLSLQKKKRKRIQLTKQINFFSEKKNQTKIRQNNKKKKRTFLFNLNPPLLCVCAQREKTSTDLVN